MIMFCRTFEAQDQHTEMAYISLYDATVSFLKRNVACIAILLVEMFISQQFYLPVVQWGLFIAIAG